MVISHVGSSSGGIVTATAGDDPSVPWPTGLQADDVVVCAIAYGGTAEPGTFTGWTKAISGLSGTSQSPGGGLYYRLATGSESGSLTITNATSGAMRAFMTAYRGVDISNILDVSPTEASFAAGVTAFTVPQQDPTMVGDTFVGMTVGNTSGGTFTPPTAPAAWTELADDGTTPHVSVAHLVNWSGDTATGNFNFVRSSGIRGYAAVLALRPAVVSAVFEGWGVPI